jgi:hypothetical protein
VDGGSARFALRYASPEVHTVSDDGMIHLFFAGECYEPAFARGDLRAIEAYRRAGPEFVRDFNGS